jgi:putative ABC transport system ATP-binding protein
MLEVEGVTKIFNQGSIDEKVALQHVNLKVEKGEFVTIIGSNGAGKTTLLNVITGSVLVDDGNVVIDGLDVTPLPEFKRGRFIGRVFQNPLMGTASEMTIEENLSMALLRGKPRGLKKGVTKNHRSIYQPILQTLGLGLEYRLIDRVGLLSGGQRQSLAILMATLSLPKVLLLDEHTASLDPKTATVVMDLTERVIKENGLTTLMVTHNMEQAIRYGNRLVMMHEGKIILDVSGEEKTKLTIPELIQRFGVVDEKLLLA